MGFLLGKKVPASLGLSSLGKPVAKILRQQEKSHLISSYIYYEENKSTYLLFKLISWQPSAYTSESWKMVPNYDSHQGNRVASEGDNTSAAKFPKSPTGTPGQVDYYFSP